MVGKDILKTLHALVDRDITLMLGAIFYVVGRCLWKIIRRSQYLHFER